MSLIIVSDRFLSFFFLSAVAMGEYWSYPSPPPETTKILIPPQFTQRLGGPATEDYVLVPNPQRPVYRMFLDQLWRRELFNLYMTDKSGVDIRANLAPHSDALTFVQSHIGVHNFGAPKVSGSLGFVYQKFPEAATDSQVALRVALSRQNGLQGGLFALKPFSNFGLFGAIRNTNAGPVIRVQGGNDRFALGLESVVVNNGATPSPALWAMGKFDKFRFGMEVCPKKWINFMEPQVLLGACFRDEVPNGKGSRYEMSASYDVFSKTVTLATYHHLVTQRKIYNILEDADVKYISNYVDIGMEVRSAQQEDDKEPAFGLTSAVSWQINKNLLVKARLCSDRGAALCLAGRNWWSPSVIGSVTAGVDRNGKPYIGVKGQLQNWGETRYEAGTRASGLHSNRWQEEDVRRVERFSEEREHKEEKPEEPRPEGKETMDQPDVRRRTSHFEGEQNNLLM